ncbi:MAG: cupin domain-containing protein [Alphaproteobacteria bacterium]
MQDWLVGFDDIMARMPDPAAADPVVYPIRHGSMRVGLYAPRGSDPQEPHSQDELYIVARGSGQFVKDGDTRPVGPGDLIFVEAGAAHRFLDFSDDFVTWVVFWGPQGGEAR